jgi:hypothetical protein
VVSRRIIIVLLAIAAGAAAPARAWCEASCLVPRHDAPSHCPSHELPADTSGISATSGEECPALNSARSTTTARLDAGTVFISVHSPALRISAIPGPSPLHRHNATTVFERSIPLRI